MERPYLRPIYDDPEFIVHTIWRRYGGWWDGNPATLKPAREQVLAAELAALAGGAGVLADRAVALLEQADAMAGATDGTTDGGAAAGASDSSDADALLRLAGHLAETAWLAGPDDVAIRRVRQAVFTRRSELATSTMSTGVFSWAARESGHPPPADDSHRQ
jgi:hypothetical protein